MHTDTDTNRDADTHTDTDADTDADVEGEPCPGVRAEIYVQPDVATYAHCETLETIYVHATTSVTDVSLPLLETVEQDVYLHANADVATLSLPALQSVGGYFYLYQNPLLDEVSAPGLQTIGDYLYVDTNEGLTLLDFTAALTLVGSTTYVVGNSALCVPALDWAGITTGTVTISGNATCP